MIAPWLMVGPALSPPGYASLKSAGVTHVIDLREEGMDDFQTLHWLGFRWWHLPVRDHRPPTAAQVDSLVTWLAQQALPEMIVYLHCDAGRGRAPTVAIALLMLEGMPFQRAYDGVRRWHSESMLTDSQVAWLREDALVVAPPA